MEKLFKLQKALEKVVVLVSARMPEAQRLMEKGDDLQWHEVTSTLERLHEALVIVRDLIVLESGNPDFGVGAGLTLVEVFDREEREGGGHES